MAMISSLSVSYPSRGKPFSATIFFRDLLKAFGVVAGRDEEVITSKDKTEELKQKYVRLIATAAPAIGGSDGQGQSAGGRPMLALPAPPSVSAPIPTTTSMSEAARRTLQELEVDDMARRRRMGFQPTSARDHTEDFPFNVSKVSVTISPAHEHLLTNLQDDSELRALVAQPLDGHVPVVDAVQDKSREKVCNVWGPRAAMEGKGRNDERWTTGEDTLNLRR